MNNVKRIAAPKELFSRAWTALKATWPIVLPLVAGIQLASYVLGQLVGLIPGLAGTLLSFVTTALIMVPTVGVLSGTLGYLRKKPLTYDCIRSMQPHALKIIGLYLWTMLCLFAWMLPGMGGMVIGTIMLAFGQKLPVLGILGGLTMIAGVIAMIVLGIRAAFSYAMNNCILIDDPAASVRDILKKSKAMMQGYRWHYFKMGLPVFAAIFVFVFVISLLTAVLPAWLASLISSAMSVLTAVLSQYLLPVMYEELLCIKR
jgi:uncharacterized membrane protein